MQNDTINTSAKSTPNVSLPYKADKQKDGSIMISFVGKYRNYQAEAYRDAQRLLGLSQKQALGFAIALGSEVGRIFSTANNEVSIGNLSKRKNSDGTLTVREVAKMKTHLTVALALNKLLSILFDAQDYGLDNSTGKHNYIISPQHLEWVNKVAVKDIVLSEPVVSTPELQQQPA